MSVRARARAFLLARVRVYTLEASTYPLMLRDPWKYRKAACALSLARARDARRTVFVNFLRRAASSFIYIYMYIYATRYRYAYPHLRNSNNAIRLTYTCRNSIRERRRVNVFKITEYVTGNFFSFLFFFPRKIYICALEKILFC